MTREEISSLISSNNYQHIVLELSTGMGKTRMALEYINKINPKNILIVIPRLVLINNWKEEINKWGYSHLLDRITFSTYVSLHKQADTNWDIICYDEAHHLSERCRETDLLMPSKHKLFLSATLKKEHKYWIKHYYPTAEFISVSLKEAINNEVLPDPKVYLIPLTLDNCNSTELLIKTSF
jgi:superfamily II DNA or RNA helicase